jgi:transcriptional regulator with XRE-family HTH domain
MTTGALPLPSFLRDSRQARGLSQRRLATLLGVTNTQVSRWEQGMDVPRLERLSQIAGALNVSMRQLVEAIVESAQAA